MRACRDTKCLSVNKHTDQSTRSHMYTGPLVITASSPSLYLNPCKVWLCHGVYGCPNQAGLTVTNNDEYTFVKKMFIPCKKVYKFGSSDTSAVTHNQDDLYFSILCYDVFGSLAFDNIAYFQCYTELLFKDP